MHECYGACLSNVVSGLGWIRVCERCHMECGIFSAHIPHNRSIRSVWRSAVKSFGLVKLDEERRVIFPCVRPHTLSINLMFINWSNWIFQLNTKSLQMHTHTQTSTCIVLYTLFTTFRMQWIPKSLWIPCLTFPWQIPLGQPTPVLLLSPHLSHSPSQIDLFS